MKFTQSIIVAALLGAITQQELVAGVQLTHRHHHRHQVKHQHHHYPKNIGVRFIQSQDEGTTAADPSVVEDAVPETEATKVAEETAVAAIKQSQEKAAAIAEAVVKAEEKAAEAAEAPIEPSAEQAVAAKPETMEEYKNLKEEVTAEAAALTAEPDDLTEEEQLRKEKKEVDDLTDKADQTKHQKQADLAQKELANIEKDEKLLQKLAKDPNNQATQEEVAEASMQLKKDAKTKLKLQKQLADVSSQIVVDEEKAANRAAEAAEELAQRNAQKLAVAAKQAKLAQFEEEKKEADNKITQEFKDQLPEYVPKKAVMPEDDKLSAAQKKLDALNAADEKAEEARQAEIEENKTEVGPNIADAAIAKAEAEFDEQKEKAQAAAAAQVQAKVVVMRQNKNSQAAERASTPHTHGEAWTAAMPSYVSESVPFRPVQKKDDKTMRLEAEVEVTPIAASLKALS